MDRIRWQLLFGLFLIVMSVLTYLMHYAIFRDSHHIFIYLLGDIAFLPVEVLFVTLIVDRLMSAREKRSMMKKLNMVIGAFFSELGNQLLTSLSDFIPNFEDLRAELVKNNDWSDKSFVNIGKRLKSFDYHVENQRGDLEELKKILMEKRNFLLRLLENPNMLEHESFTDLLCAVFHLTEELACRGDFAACPLNDQHHLSGDIKRIYVLLIVEWLSYMRHLRDEFPYLFSLASRMNPLNPYASPNIT